MIANAVGEDPFRRQFDDIVGKELEREQALAARHHNQRRLLDPAAEDAHALPRVLAKVAHADVEDGATHQVDGFKSGAVEPRRKVAIIAVVMRVAHRHWCASRSVTSTS